MLESSIKKLSDIYDYFYQIGDKHFQELCKDIIRAEAITPAKGSKFNLYNYVCKDRPSLSGVFHGEGFKVASDARIMHAQVAEYPEELEGKIVAKDGSFIEGVFPRWKSIIPNGDGYVEYEIDEKKFYNWLTERRAQIKTETGMAIKWGLWNVKVGPAYLRAEFFDKLLTSLKELGTTKLLVKDSRKAVYAKTDKGIVILMPIIIEAIKEPVILDLV